MTAEKAPEQVFANIKDVVAYLSTQGFKIKKSACYLHSSQGKLLPQADGTFTAKAVLKYASLFLKRRDGQPSTGRIEAAQEGRLEAESRKVRLQADRLHMQNELLSGRFVEKVEFERALALRAQLFRTDIETFCRGSAGEIINLVGGDFGKTSDLIEFMVRKAGDWLERYTSDEEMKPMTAFPENLEINDDLEIKDDDEDPDYPDDGVAPDQA
jgi:hypothetical protein